MEKVRIDEIGSLFGPAAVKRPVSDELGTSDVAMNYYELDPGDSFAFGYHRHHDQEEVFYILEGTVTFETEDDSFRAQAGEFVRFAPGEFQRGVNESDSRVVGLALGAPRDSEDIDILRECEDCGERTQQRIELMDDRDALVSVCEGCGGTTGRFVHGEEPV